MSVPVHRYSVTTSTEGDFILVFPEAIVEASSSQVISSGTIPDILNTADAVITSECTIFAQNENDYTILVEYFDKVIPAYFYRIASPLYLNVDDTHRIGIYYDGYRVRSRFERLESGDWVNRVSGNGFPNYSNQTLTCVSPLIVASTNVFYIALTRSTGSIYNLTYDSVSGSTIIADLTAYWEGVEEYTPGPSGEDPYEQGGESSEGGGEGDFDNTTEPIPIPLVPSISVDDTGFISLYNPTLAELRSLATYLWSANGLDLDTFKRIFTDPISTILGLTIVPVSPTLASTRTVKLGNVDTGVSMARVDQQYVRHDCGTINVNEYWGGYLDYSPYTSAEIYLPYIGTKPINIDDIMGKSVHVVYTIDLLSGACCALIECGSSVLYQFIGQCACSVPVTGNDMTNLINGILSVVGAGAGAFVATGNVATAMGATVGSLANNVTKSKPHVEKSGSMGSMGGMLGIRNPYLILTRPRQALPAAQNRYTGYPSYISTMMGDLVGYTEMFSVHLGDMPATAEEKAEIEALLKSGVIF